MKSIETQFAEAMDALRKVGKQEVFSEKAAKLITIESKLNCAEEVLKSARVIRKHNGAADNGHEFRESFSGDYVSEVTDPREAQVKSYMLTCNISENDARKVLGLAPKEFNRRQAAEYQFAKGIGLSEADALRLAKQV